MMCHLTGGGQPKGGDSTEGGASTEEGDSTAEGLHTSILHPSSFALQTDKIFSIVTTMKDRMEH